MYFRDKYKKKKFNLFFLMMQIYTTTSTVHDSLSWIKKFQTILVATYSNQKQRKVISQQAGISTFLKLSIKEVLHFHYLIFCNHLSLSPITICCTNSFHQVILSSMSDNKDCPSLPPSALTPLTHTKWKRKGIICIHNQELF